jgi:BCD family chlorophyll transporter-like MFS transporter
MNALNHKLARAWLALGPNLLPFADAATRDLPLGRLLRLSLFQVSVGLSAALLTGTLNRVMIVELGAAASLVAGLVALPLLLAPLRALLGHRSDTHRSFLGWRRVPYLWGGTMLSFGGLAILPFALLVMSGQGNAPALYGQIGCGLAFLLIGAGLHTTQTAGLALACDLAPPAARPRVVALLYVMLLIGMGGSALAFGALLTPFDHLHLIQVIQGAALVTMALNGIALWKQEPRDPARTAPEAPRPTLQESWAAYRGRSGAGRYLTAVALGTAGFSMQDILLEPYGGHVLELGVGATSALTALLAAGTLGGFALAARALGRGMNMHRLAAAGVLVGLAAFACVIFAAPLESTLLFRVGATAIGLGTGLFSVGTLTAAMARHDTAASGLAVGAWGAVQATAAGVAIAGGGALRDVVGGLAESGALGVALANPSTGYSVVYHLEIALLFAALVALGPLVRHDGEASRVKQPFGLAEFPSP